ncbi:MAG: hypothetical protein J0L94_05970 [Rhodothermia bacterium]|nr:hypothetical protein [Rhodothermia bacterium]
MSYSSSYPPEVPLKTFDPRPPYIDPEPEKPKSNKSLWPLLLVTGSILGLIAGGVWGYQAWVNAPTKKDKKPQVSVSKLLAKTMDRAKMAQPHQHPHKVFLGSKGEVYVQQEMPVYVKISVSEDPNAPSYRLTGMNTAPMKLDGPGEHHLRHSHTERGGADLNIFNLTSDDAAPKVWTEFKGAELHAKDSTVYYGKGLQVEVKSEDKISGLQESYVSVDGATFIANRSVLIFDKEKPYSLRTYGVDNVGNAGKPKEELFIVDLTAPKSKMTLQKPYVSETISPQTTVVLSAEDNLSGVRKIYYRYEGETTYREYDGKSIQLGGLNEGGNKLYYYAIDHVGNREPDNVFSFYFDLTSPLSSSEIKGDKFFVNNRQYVSPRTEVELAAADNKIGVNRIEYQINEGGFVKYLQPFKVPQNNGEYRIDYRSTDNVENTSKPKRMVVYMDLEKPISDYVFDGPTFMLRDTLYITTRTLLKLPATDKYSTVKLVNYKKDTDPQKIFSKPFVIQGRGFHEVIFHAIDQVNNREANRRVAFVVDDRPPQIFSHLSANKYEDIRQGNEVLGVYPQLTQIFLAATDDISGTKSIWYSINGGKEMPFVGSIKGLKQGIYTIDIRAQDNVTNESRSRVRFAIGRF